MIVVRFSALMITERASALMERLRFSLPIFRTRSIPAAAPGRNVATVTSEAVTKLSNRCRLTGIATVAEVGAVYGSTFPIALPMLRAVETVTPMMIPPVRLTAATEIAGALVTVIERKIVRPADMLTLEFADTPRARASPRLIDADVAALIERTMPTPRCMVATAVVLAVMVTLLAFRVATDAMVDPVKASVRKRNVVGAIAIEVGAEIVIERSRAAGLPTETKDAALIDLFMPMPRLNAVADGADIAIERARETGLPTDVEGAQVTEIETA
jgi:hypothetical protein